MATKSSIKRKPLSDLTNLAPKPYHHHSSLLSQSKKPKSTFAVAVDVSSVSGSSIGSSQNANHVKLPVRSDHRGSDFDDEIGDENRIAYSQRQSTPKITSKPVNQTSLEKTRTNGKERSVAHHCSTLENVKDQGKGTYVPVNQPSLEKTHDREEINMALRPSMTEKAKDKGKAIDSTGNQPSLERTGNNGKKISGSMLKKINDKGKAIALPVNQPCLDKDKSVARHSSSVEKIKDKEKAIATSLSYLPKKKAKNILEAINVPLSGVRMHEIAKATDVLLSHHPMKNVNHSTDTPKPHFTVNIRDKGKEIDVSRGFSPTEDLPMPNSATKRKDKGNAIVGSLSHPPIENVKNSMGDIRVPLSGAKIKDRGRPVLGTSIVDLANKNKGKAVATPIGSRTQEMDKSSSCPPPRRTRNNRNEVNGAEYISQSKSKTAPPVNKKKRRCLSKDDVEEYTLPQDFVEQQRAYFKEIDDFELPVEEVSEDEYLH